MSSAARAGRFTGNLIFILGVVSLLWVGVVSIARAFTRRTPGWIIAGIILGLPVAIAVAFLLLLLFVALVQFFFHGAKVGASGLPELSPAQWGGFFGDITGILILVIVVSAVFKRLGIVGKSANPSKPPKSAKSVATPPLPAAANLPAAGAPEPRAGKKKTTIGTILALALGIYAIWWLVSFMQGFMEGFNRAVHRGQRPPSAGEAPLPPTSVQTPIVTVTGSTIPFTLQVPEQWNVRRNVSSFDSLLSDGIGYVAVAAAKPVGASTEAAAQTARQRAQASGTVVAVGNNYTVEIDGRHWIAFAAQARKSDAAFAYQYYVYSGREGTVQLVGWAPQSRWASESPQLESIMRTIHLPAR